MIITAAPSSPMRSDIDRANVRWVFIGDTTESIPQRRTADLSRVDMRSQSPLRWRAGAGGRAFCVGGEDARFAGSPAGSVRFWVTDDVMWQRVSSLPSGAAQIPIRRFGAGRRRPCWPSRSLCP